MKRYFSFLIVIGLFISLSRISIAGWWRTYGGASGETGQSVEVLDDTSYMICGGTLYEIEPDHFSARGFLLKTGPSGDSLWMRIYTISYDISCQFYSFHKTEDKGYIITGYGTGYGPLRDVAILRTDSGGDSVWALRYGGDDIEARGRFIRQTADGGYVIAGEIGPPGERDIWLLRTDSLGDTMWTRNLGWEDDDNAWCVKQTSDGNYVVVGYGETLEGDFTRLLKLDDEGNLLWEHQYGNYSQGRSVIETSDGGLLVAGSAWDYGAVYLLKTDENGDSLWSRTYWNTAWCQANCVEQTSDGGFIIAAVSELIPLSSRSDGWLLRTDSAGDTLWTRQMISTQGGKNYLSCVKQTQDGGYIISGSTGSREAPKAFEIWLVKTDSLGLLGIEEFDNPPSVEASTVVGRGVTFTYSNLNSGFHAVVYTSAGQRIAEIHSDSSSGTVTWGQGQRPGVYFIRELTGVMPVRKVVLIR